MTIVSIALIIVLIVLFAAALRAHWSSELKLVEVTKERDALRQGQQGLRKELDSERYTAGNKFSRLEHQHHCLKNDYKSLSAERDELASKLRERRQLAAVKFTAHVPHLGWAKTEFKLGLGPCGLTVDSLQFEEKPDRFVLTQWCTNGERKEFTYMKVDISGRIERAYRKPE